MKQNTSVLLRNLCVIMLTAAMALMIICLADVISGGQMEAHALDYRVELKSVKPSGGGYKVTWAKPDIKVSGFRIEVSYPGGHKFFFAGKDATSKTIKKLGKKYFNMFDDYAFYVQAYKNTSSGKKDYGDPSNSRDPRVDLTIPVTEHADRYWSDYGLILDSTKYVYDGKTHKPSVKVKFIKDTTSYPQDKTKLDKKYYTVKYSKGCKAIGKYKIKVTLKGKYRGTSKAFFYIVPKATSLVSLSASKDGSEGVINVKWKKQASRTSGYQVFYSYDSWEGSEEDESPNFVEKVKLVKGRTKTSVKLTGLIRHRTYQVAVRTYKVVNKRKVYSKWSAPKTVKIP